MVYDLIDSEYMFIASWTSSVLLPRMLVFLQRVADGISKTRARVVQGLYHDKTDSCHHRGSLSRSICLLVGFRPVFTVVSAPMSSTALLQCAAIKVLNHVIACIWYLVGYLTMEAGRCLNCLSRAFLL